MWQRAVLQGRKALLIIAAFLIQAKISAIPASFHAQWETGH